MKVLLAIEGSPCSMAAVQAVALRPWPEGSKVKVVTVVEFPHIAGSELWVLKPGYIEQLENAEQDRVEALIKRTVATLHEETQGKLNVFGEVLKIGDPKEVILEEADKWGADLIVLGSHGYHGFKRFWLGSVSLAVASGAQCSVEIVRCPGAKISFPAKGR